MRSNWEYIDKGNGWKLAVRRYEIKTIYCEEDMINIKTGEEYKKGSYIDITLGQYNDEGIWEIKDSEDNYVQKIN